MKKLFLTLIFLLTATSLWGANFTPFSPTQRLATAIARAEGFGIPKAIPTRFHNPGDIRSHFRHAYPGQVGLSKHGYVIFRTDADGWAALRGQLERIISGTSKYYTVNMTLKQLAHKYAESPTWGRNVSKSLGTSTNAYLWEVLNVSPKLEAAWQS